MRRLKKLGGKSKEEDLSVSALDYVLVESFCTEKMAP